MTIMIINILLAITCIVLGLVFMSTSSAVICYILVIVGSILLGVQAVLLYFAIDIQLKRKKFKKSSQPLTAPVPINNFISALTQELNKIPFREVYDADEVAQAFFTAAEKTSVPQSKDEVKR